MARRGTPWVRLRVVAVGPQPHRGVVAAPLLAGDALDRQHHVLQRLRHGQAVAQGEEHLSLPVPVVRPGPGVPREDGEALVGQLGRAGVGHVREAVELLGGPVPWHVVDRAQGPHRRPGVVRDRVAGVGDDAEVVDRPVGAQPVVLPRVGDHQGGLVGNDVLAEAVGQRGLPAGGPGLAQPDLAAEHLAVGLHDRDQRTWHAEQLAHEPGVAVEGRSELSTPVTPRGRLDTHLCHDGVQSRSRERSDPAGTRPSASVVTDPWSGVDGSWPRRGDTVDLILRTGSARVATVELDVTKTSRVRPRSSGAATSTAWSRPGGRASALPVLAPGPRLPSPVAPRPPGSGRSRRHERRRGGRGDPRTPSGWRAVGPTGPRPVRTACRPQVSAQCPGHRPAARTGGDHQDGAPRRRHAW